MALEFRPSPARCVITVFDISKPPTNLGDRVGTPIIGDEIHL